MPFARYSLTELRHQAEQDALAATPAAGGLLRNSVLRILAWTQAGLAHLHYGYLDWIARQAIPATATDEHLAQWAALVGITRVLPGTATGTATFTGMVDTKVNAGTQLRRSDNVLFVTTSSGSIGQAGTLTLNVSATAAGSAGNTTAGTSVVLTTPVPGVASTASLGAVAGGTDIEDDESLRNRMLLRYANPPQGGAKADYLEWALSVPGITRAWVAGGVAGSGSVTVYVMTDGNTGTSGFPTGTGGVATSEPRGSTATGDLLAVANYIYPRRPVTALVTAQAPVAYPVNVTISNLSISSADTQAGIIAALKAMLLAKGDALGGALYQSDFEAAIAAVTGVNRFSLVAPGVIVSAPAGQLPVLGTVTFQ